MKFTGSPRTLYVQFWLSCKMMNAHTTILYEPLLLGLLHLAKVKIIFLNPTICVLKDTIMGTP